MYLIGIDEAGRWPWAGPVVACSFTFWKSSKIPWYLLSQITDSKKLSPHKRELLFDTLVALSMWNDPAVYFWVWVVDNYLIDQINIRQANKEAMRRSLIELSRKIDVKNISQILVDGKDNYHFEWYEKLQYIVGWDGKVVEIGAASIIAKVFRDKLMSTYAILYPNLWLENHKGYGTKKHIEYLEDISKVTGIHRVSYKPVAKILSYIW